jgi:superfamily II DNA or RNA helicase
MTSINLRPHQEDALISMDDNSIGKIVLGTGAGKSIIFIQNTIKQFESSTPQTVCIVAPRILLACQLSEEYGKFVTNAKCIHIHSGSNLKHYRTTNPQNLKDWYNIHQNHHKLIFTSYNSLKKVIESGIKVDVYNFDESHNSTKKNFFPHVEEAVKKASEAGVMSLTSSFNYERNNFRGEKPASELWYISDVDGEIDINSMDSSEEIDISEIIKNL